MAVIRGPNRGGDYDEPTRRVSGTDSYDERTVVARPRSQDPTIAAQTQHHGGDGEKTRVVGTRSSAAQAQARDFLDDPVVGWLVVTEGPGKGCSLKIGYGQNSIGRTSGQRIQLDFGDDGISREAHAFITYDPKGRKFYVMNGGGSNLIYIGESPVLAPTELKAGIDLMLGRTTVRFVPFCGPAFDWQDKGAQDGS